MLRNTSALLQRYGKQKKIDLKTSFSRVTSFNSERKKRLTTIDNEVVVGAGKVRSRQQDKLKQEIEKMEHPAIWLWYPWRKNPEPPTPFMPQRRALKNLHGAVFSELSPTQRRKQNEMFYGINISDTRQTQFDQRHPYLSNILKSTEGKAKGFPFWYKKYPTRRHAFETRFNIPKEMLEGYPEEIKKAVSFDMMSVREKQLAQEAMYMERYAQHDFDTNSTAVAVVRRAIQCRTLRNHLLTNPHNNIMKSILALRERSLMRKLRRLRKENFKLYWELIRDHDIQEMVQPANAVTYRWGAYWMYEWNHGFALSTNISDFMDPRGMNGCVETGRSRSEVARDLGLTYTRALHPHERKQLEQAATYHERLSKFKAEQPESARVRERQRFVNKFSSLFVKMGTKAKTVDFPSTYRRLLGVKVLRWKSKRHGPA